MLMLIVWAANIFIILAALFFAWVIKVGGLDFSLGVIFATAVYNICHRVIYGRWL